MSDFREFVLEQVRGLGVVMCKPMFGGYGLSHGGSSSGSSSRAGCTSEVSDASKGDYVKAGSEAFVPNKGRTLGSFYEVPAEVVEAPKRTVEWAREAVRAAGISEDDGPQGDRIVRHQRR